MFPKKNLSTENGTFACLLLLSCIVLHGSEGSAWRRNLGVPLSDLRLLCGSIDGWGGELGNIHPKFYT